MSEQNELFRLHQFIIEHYNLDEMKSLCLVMQVNYDDLSGDTISSKSRELIVKIGQEERFAELLTELARLRPTPFSNAQFSVDDEGLDLLYKSMPNFSASKIDIAHYDSLIASAYKSENYSEVYRYATVLIDEPTNKNDSWAWMHKGLSAGYLSNSDSVRFSEMIACVNKARSLDLGFDEDDFDWLSIQVSYIVTRFTKRLVAQLEDFQQTARVSTPRTYSPPQKTISESLATGLAAGATDVMRQNSAAKQFAMRAGNEFQASYSKPIIQGLNYAWSISSSSKQNAINIKVGINSVIGTQSLNADTKNCFKDQVSELINQIKEAYPDIEFLEVKKDSRCFIATATLGSSEHPDVVKLREFRDYYLVNHPLGQIFVEYYYLISPPLANFIASRTELRRITYYLLIRPMVKFVEFIM